MHSFLLSNSHMLQGRRELGLCPVFGREESQDWGWEGPFHGLYCGRLLPAPRSEQLEAPMGCVRVSVPLQVGWHDEVMARTQLR